MDESLLIDEHERLRIDTINKVRHIQSLNLDKQIIMRIEEDPKAREYYDIYKSQCEINGILNKLCSYIKNRGNGTNTSYRFNQKLTFDVLVNEEDFSRFVMANIIPRITTEVIDENDKERIEARDNKRKEIISALHKCDMEEMRSLLYYCYSIKPVPIPKPDSKGSVDVLQCFAAGINPDAIYGDPENWFIEENEYKYFLGDIREIITNGTMLGVPIATRIPIESTKKY